MARIEEAVKSNVNYREQYPGDNRPTSNGLEFSRHLPTLAAYPPTSFPVRGTLPQSLLGGHDFYEGTRAFKIYTRSSVMLPPNAVSKSNTPQSLISKKLISPIIGGGSALNRYNAIRAIITPVSVGANTTVTQTFTVSGISGADQVIGFQWTAAQQTGVVVLAVRVAGDGQLAIDFSNPTAGGLIPTGGGITLILVR